MADELFFIRILGRALKEPNVGAALGEAFQRIQLLGQQEEYHRGYQQFRQFMIEAARASDAPHDHIDNFTADAVAGTEADPEMLHQGTIAVTLILELEGQLPRSATLPPVGGPAVFENLPPGEYRLKLETGWLLWEKALEASQLLWESAYPGGALELAADTGADAPLPTVHTSLLEGELELRVYAGLESGRIEIERRC